VSAGNHRQPANPCYSEFIGNGKEASLMKIVTALLTALTLLGAVGAAWADCPGHQTTAQQDTAKDDPILFPKTGT
jgi:hypothetical protein